MEQPSHSPKQRVLERDRTSGLLKLSSAAPLKRAIPAFQYKSLVTVLQKAIRITTQHNIRVTVFIECPDQQQNPDEKRPPPILVGSPVSGEEFPAYFSNVLLPGATALMRDDRYHTRNVEARVQEVLEERAGKPDEGEDVQIETLFVSPETVRFTQRGDDGRRPVLSTVYHRLANI